MAAGMAMQAVAPGVPLMAMNDGSRQVMMVATMAVKEKEDEKKNAGILRNYMFYAFQMSENVGYPHLTDGITFS